MPSAPASAKLWIWRSGRSIIRWTSRTAPRPCTCWASPRTSSYGREHRALAVVALVERGVGHPHDRGGLPAVGADRTQLEPGQAVHAAVAPGQVGRAQPRLVAVRAHRPEVDVLLSHGRPGR